MINTTETINNIEDVKVKLWADNKKLNAVLDDIQSKKLTVEDNIQILELNNTKIKD